MFLFQINQTNFGESILKDRDLFVMWNRIDEPGQNPTWESQCGIIEQVSFGDNPTYLGYVLGKKNSYSTTTIASMKTLLKKEYLQEQILVWNY